MKISNYYLTIIFAVILVVGLILSNSQLKAQYCAGTDTLTDSIATFDDGSNGAYYENNSDCKYLIQPGGEGFIILTFYHFMTEEDNDYLRIYDGPDTNAPLLGEYSGWMTPPDIISSDNELLLHFITNDTITDFGWEVHYELSKTYCSAVTILEDSSGNFSDGSGSMDYGNYSDCLWLIQPTEEPSYINLNFNSFETEQDFDYVRIYDGATTEAPLLASYCGYVDTTAVPPDVSSSGSSMLVRFTTDVSVVNSGWDASYSSTYLYCYDTIELNALDGTFSDGSGSEDYLNNSDCKWLIHPPDDVSSITLSFDSFNIENTYDYVRVYDGNSASAPLLGEFTGNISPPDINSSGNVMLVHFIANGSGTAPGWEANYSSTIDSLSVSPSDIYLSSDAGDSVSFNISTNTNWTVNTDQDWLSVMPENGANDETVYITTEEENTLLSPRTATITVSWAGENQTVDATQAASDPFIEIQADSIFLSCNAGSSDIFNVLSNVNWSVNSGESWLSVSPASDSANGVVTVTAISENTMAESRVATINIAGTDLLPEQVIITQEGTTPILSVSPSVLTLNSDIGSSATFDITANVEWEISSDQSWLNVSPSSGSDNNGITVLAMSENTSPSARTAHVTVSGEGLPDDTVYVTQQGVSPALSAFPDTIVIQSAESSENTLNIISNIDWQVNSYASWLTISPDSGANNGIVTLTANTENTNLSSKITEVIISGLGIPNKTITVIQEGISPFLDVSNENITLNSSANSSSNFNVYSNVNWNISTDQSWLSVDPASGSDSSLITLTASNSNSATNARSAILTVSGQDVNPKSILITQFGTDPALSVSPETLTIGSSENGSGTFNISSNVNWTISDDQSWLDVSPASGSASSIITVAANSANTSVSERTATVAVNSPNTNSQLITVIQEGTPPELHVSGSQLTLNPISGSFNHFDITANTDWEISSNVTWLSVNPMTGSNNGTITVLADSTNNTTHSRYGMLTVSSGGVSKTVIVIQEKVKLQASTDSLYLTASSGSYDIFSINANVDWNISDDASWITTEPFNGTGNSIVTVTAVTSNNAQNPRYATISIFGTYAETSSIVIKQNSSTGIDVISSMDSISIYPNPVKHNLYIDTYTEVHGKIELINATGSVVKSKVLKKENIINMKDQAPGLYYLHLMIDDQRYTRKIVKM